MAAPMFHRAKMFERALITLHDKQPDNSIPIAYIAALAVEIGLKAYLLWTGKYKEKDIKSPKCVGHDLVKAWEKANDSGLALDPSPPYWLVRLSELNNESHLLRYAHTNISAMVLPNKDSLREGVVELLAKVEGRLQSADLPPRGGKQEYK
ncbi:MAG: hypothetical protein KF886_00045 [Candidatus Hydrogenedentes bacterium]|nr:hypothetical protein [Candidatus Hydrogenedentota bacterium]